MNDLLASDHRDLDRLLARLWESFNSGNAAKVFGQLDHFWARLAMHIRAENLHLFPALRAVFDQKDERKLIIERLRRDHNFFMTELSSAMKQLRLLATNKWADETVVLENVQGRLLNLSLRLKEHDGLEEEEVYLWAEMEISPEEIFVLKMEVKKELNSLPPRFL